MIRQQTPGFEPGVVKATHNNGELKGVNWQTYFTAFGEKRNGRAGLRGHKRRPRWHSVGLADGVRKPRVMQLVLSLSPGGTERLVIEIVRALSQQIESIVCCLDQPGAWAEELADMAVPVISLSREPGFHPALALRLARILKERDIDIIHCHHYSPYVYGLLASILNPRVQLVFTEHGRLSDAAPSRKRRLVNPILSRWPGKLCAVSADLKNHLVAEGFPAGRVGVTYNGIEPGHRPSTFQRAAARAALGLPESAFVIGTVGRLDRVKNLQLLLDAHALLRTTHPNVRTVIVGDGDQRAALEAHAQTLGGKESITFAGYRSDVRLLMSDDSRSDGDRAAGRRDPRRR
jgi:glycosyltransferase involved in cell wall biosynthesis